MSSTTSNPLSTPFGAHTTATDVLDGVSLHGRRAVVTGGSSGIGLETARALASAGAEVTLAVRDLDAGARAAAAVTGEASGAAARVAHLDLTDRSSIVRFAEQWTGALDILVNNAGVMAVPELHRTEQGWERQLATNHLGSAELTLALRQPLAAAESARVVQVASSAHLMAPVDLDDLHFENRPYDGWTAYAQSKTAMILFTVALAQRWAADGTSVNALHPGGIMTNLQRHLDDAQLGFVGAKDEAGRTLEVPPGWKTVAQGAATSVLLAGSPLVEGVTGRYFEDVNEAPVQPEPAPGKTGVAPWAIDRDTADRLYAVTLELLGHRGSA